MAFADAPPAQSETNRIGLPAAGIAVSVAARLVSLHGLHPLNWDEIEFFRATDWVRRGLVPYRDFWEHHSPLQWFVFAPFTALTHSPGADAVILMRWAQVPLWIAAFVLINVWMRDAAIAPRARWSAMAVALASSLFMLPAVEYRVDVLAGTLFILGLVCLQRIDRGLDFALAAGAAFCLAAFANLRLAPVIAVAMLIGSAIERGRWMFQRRAPWMFGAALATLAIGAAYLVLTGSMAIAIRRLWTENYLADRFASNVPGIFLHRVVAPFGFRVVQFEGVPWFGASAVDPGGVLLVALGVIGLSRALRTWRVPDALFLMAIVQIANVGFIASMRYVFNYHLEVAAVLMVPFIAGEFQRFRVQSLATAALCVTVVVNVAVAVLRGKEADTAYQNRIMRTVDARTLPGAPVWDSVGWAIRHPPAYGYWFLRMIVVVLEGSGRFEPYTVADVVARPPAAIIADHDTRLWMLRHPPLGRFITAHYLPLWRDLWLPGMSARLTPDRPAAEWIVPADGTYRILASHRLASHPWFREPLAFETAAWSNLVTEADRYDTAAPALVCSEPTAGDRVTLRRSQRLRCALTAPDAIGMMLVLERPEELFQQPAPGVTLEASASPRWHIPDLAALDYGK